MISFQNIVKKKIHQFDIISLLKTLSDLGYKSENIFFKANTSFSSHASICEDIIFSSESYPQVTIIINLGLLSNNSSLPTLFWKKMDEGSIQAGVFLKYFSFFDHYMIRNFLSMGMAEENGYFFSNWKETLSQYLHLLALNSSSTLEHLFQLCFPEFQVRVFKHPRVVSFQTSSIVLGVTLLGKECYFEKNEKYTISTLKIVLTIDEVVFTSHRPWPVEIKRRIKEWLFPIIERVNVYISIIFVDKNGKNSIRLSPTSHLGYSSLGESQDPLQLVLFRGYPKLIGNWRINQL